MPPKGGLAVADYFEMHNGVHESEHDVDLGSGGAILLPDLKDSSGTTRQLAAGAGKDNNLYLVNRHSMGKFDPNRQRMTIPPSSTPTTHLPCRNSTTPTRPLTDAITSARATSSSLPSSPTAKCMWERLTA
jgi:hypothetical protein